MPEANPPKTKRGRATREKILAAARSLMAGTDPGSVTLEKVGERAGVANCSIVWHFGSKENLILAVMDEVLHEFEAAFSAYPFSGKSAAEMMDRFLADYADIMAAFPEAHAVFFSLVFHRHEDPVIRGRIAVMYERYRAMVAEKLRPFVKSDPERLAPLVLALVDGMFIQWFVDPENVSPKAAFAELGREILAGKAE